MAIKQTTEELVQYMDWTQIAVKPANLNSAVKTDKLKHTKAMSLERRH